MLTKHKETHEVCLERTSIPCFLENQLVPARDLHQTKQKLSIFTDKASSISYIFVKVAYGKKPSFRLQDTCCRMCYF